MSFYKCCDCREIKASKSDLEAHLNSDHIEWSPYQCFYCCQQGVSTRKPNEEMLREHVTQIHPDQKFTFIYTDDQTNKERLKEKLTRSTSNIQSPDVGRNSPSVTVPSSDEMVSPLQPKEKIVDIAEIRGHSTSNGDGNKTLDEIEKQANDDTDIIPNPSVLGNCRCETCQESVPRNLVIIRDHVKEHFKEKTGCVPADLTHLLPSLQQIYCQLLMTSFLSIDASILNDNIPNYNRTTNQEETEDNGTIQDMDNKDNENPENDGLLVSNDSVSHDNSDSNGRENTTYMENEEEKKELRKTLIIDRNSLISNSEFNNSWRLGTSKNLPLRNIPSLKRKNKASTKKRSPSKLVEVTTNKQNPSCEICDETFASVHAVKIHRANKHGILVKWHCKECNINLGTSSIFNHLLTVHLREKISVCNLCNTFANNRQLASHDRHRHGGLGNAQVIKNVDRYRKEIGELRNTLIIDINEVGKFENSPENNSTPQGKRSRKPIPARQLKSKNPVASESVQWMLRFKRSQKRKRKQKEVLPFKRFGDIHGTMPK